MLKKILHACTSNFKRIFYLHIEIINVYKCVMFKNSLHMYYFENTHNYLNYIGVTTKG